MDRESDAAYIYLTDTSLVPGRDSVPVDPPDAEQAFVVMDWKDGRIVGLEVLDASKQLHPDLLAKAEPRIGGTHGRPRKTLEYMTPSEKFNEAVALTR